MKHIIRISLFSIWFLLITQPVSADTRSYCANKWPNDYQMREHCEKQQIEGNQELFAIAKGKGLVSNGILSTSASGGDHEKIINRCMNKWEQKRFQTYDFTMVVHCVKQQFDSYSSTVNSNSGGQPSGIKGFCANKWPSDYQMREYCEKQQIEGNQELFAIAEKNGLVKNGSLSASPKGNAIEKIFIRCMNKWEKDQFKTYDFTMVVYCVKQQIQAYRR
jgi:hypothetical protein